MTDINVTVSMDLWTSEPIKIDSSNKFVKISFHKVAMYTSITCTFINQQRKTRKSCEVQYGSAAGYDRCGKIKLSYASHVEGTILNANSLSLQVHDLSDDGTICFSIKASNGTKTVNIIGIYDGESNSTNLKHDVYSSLTVFLIGTLCTVVVMVLILVIILFYIILCFYRWKKHRKEDTSDGELDSSYMRIINETEIRQDQWKEVDTSTTYYSEPLKVEDDQILMCTVMSEKFKHYQPQDGFGYYKITTEELKSLPNHKKMLILDNSNHTPIAAIFASVVKKKIKNESLREQDYKLFVRDQSFTKRLTFGTEVLFCARSKEVLTYHKISDVTEECRESHFVARNTPGYEKEWIRYGYFQWIDKEHVKPYQHVIVIKKDGTLMTGPGIRSILGVGDGTEATQPPDNLLNERKDWKYVFVQSRGEDRDLHQGTKYLFCAVMDKVRAHYDIYDIYEKCKIAEFGKRHIPGFRPELGYGYYEFTQDEDYKPHKKVILIHKNKKLYTGAGAQFMCIEGQYSEDIKLRKAKISPPKLDKKKWLHIFIQNHSATRVLLPGTKFLYCEYKTYK